MMGELNSPPRVVVRDFTDALALRSTEELPLLETHVWRRRIDCPRTQIESLRELLTPDEEARARRFHYDKDRNEFIVSRGTLRTLIGSYLSIAPKELSFRYSEYGQPKLEGDRSIEFNVSHSGGMLLLAFSLNRRIGVDVETIRRDFSTLEIAERFFSECERRSLRELPEELRHPAFFRCWTRKEAFIKALGEGLSHPLDQFDVSLAAGAHPILLATRPDSNEASRWAMCDVAVPDGFAAALAIKLR